jgi:hypothetical protein
MFEQPVAGERYVLFPIHFQPEASTLVRAPYFLDQPALIQQIALSLPVGYRLYVKEHYTNRGRRDAGYYQRICSIHGVRLISPTANSWELIRNASAVAVITSTMGWEGILFEKPVVVFGQSFYNSFPLIYDATALPHPQWRDMFRRALYGHQTDRELLLIYIVAVLETLRPGFKANPVTFPEVLEPANIALLANATADVLGLLAPATASVV